MMSFHSPVSRITASQRLNCQAPPVTKRTVGLQPPLPDAAGAGVAASSGARRDNGTDPRVEFFHSSAVRAFSGTDILLKHPVATVGKEFGAIWACPKPGD